MYFPSIVRDREEDEFYAFLSANPSDATLNGNIFFDLTNPLEFPNSQNWRVALVSLTLPSLFTTIDNENNVLYTLVDANNPTNWLQSKISPTGAYISITTLVSTLLDAVPTDLQEKISIIVLFPQNRVRIKIREQGIFLKFSEQINYVLGFPEQSVFSFGQTLAENHYRLEAYASRITVTSPIVASSPFNNELRPVLQVVNNKPMDESSKTVTHDFSTRIYLPVRATYVSRLEFSLLDLRGRPLSFAGSWRDEIFMVLHFSQRALL